jgi:hypothetical protein
VSAVDATASTLPAPPESGEVATAATALEWALVDAALREGNALYFAREVHAENRLLVAALERIRDSKHLGPAELRYIAAAALLGGREMIPANPTDDMPSVEESCDIGGCREPWAWEVDRAHGPRKLRLCEGHADRWLRAERDLAAEREELAGRVLEFSALFGLANAMDARTWRSRARKAG